jgi:ankyrin repeat protein
MTPLHAAMRIDGPENVEMVRLLLERKANPNAGDADGLTPLMALVDRILELTQLSEEENITQDSSQGIPYCFQVLKLLIDHGADINAGDNHGNTVLPRAIPVYAPYLNLELLETFIRFGADINTPNNDGYTVLDYAFANRKIAEIYNNQKLADQYDQVCALLEKHDALKGQPQKRGKDKDKSEDKIEDKSGDEVEN